VTEGNVNEQELGCDLTTPSCAQGYTTGRILLGDTGDVEGMIECWQSLSGATEQPTQGGTGLVWSLFCSGP